MLVHQKSQLQFCSHAVSTADQNRLCNSCHIQFKQAAEPANIAHSPRCQRLCDMFFHQFYRLIARSNVYARGFIAFTLAFHFLSPLSLSLRSNLFLSVQEGISVG